MTMTYIPFTGQSVGEQQFNELAHLMALAIGQNGVFVNPPPITMNQNSALGSCAVTALGSPNMTVNVASGYVRILGAVWKSTATENLAIGASGASTDRIDRIILTCTATGSPGIVLSVLPGTPAAPGAAVPPTWTNTATSSAISLAQVLVAAGVSQIVSGAITSEIGTSVCAAIGKIYTNNDGGLNAGGVTITNVLDPVNAQDADTPTARNVAIAAAIGSATEVTGTSQAAAVNGKYITNNVGLVTVTLPATAAVGGTVRIVGKGAGKWKLGQNSGQTVYYLTEASTTGAGGSIAATGQYDCVEVMCITADTTWVVIDSVGILEVT